MQFLRLVVRCIWNRNGKERNEPVLLTIIGIVLLLAIFFIAVMIIDCNRFVIKEYTISSPKLNADETMVLLSDLHSKDFGNKNKKLKAAIDRISPDKILVAGDIYTASKFEDVSTAEDLMRYLALKYPVYYSNGNHEHKTQLYPEVFGDIYENYAETLEKAGIRHLVNEKAVLPEENTEIFGAQIDREYFGKMKRVTMKADYVTELLGSPEEEKFTILIAHNPDYFEAYADWGADLVVAGHVHGGLMRLPFLGGVISPALKLFPRYDGGKFEKDGTVMILGRGLGTHTLPIRIFNPGELVVIRCKAKNRNENTR